MHSMQIPSILETQLLAGLKLQQLRAKNDEKCSK